MRLVKDEVQPIHIEYSIQGGRLRHARLVNTLSWYEHPIADLLWSRVRHSMCDRLEWDARELIDQTLRAEYEHQRNSHY